jgi:hypothetical protein
MVARNIMTSKTFTYDNSLPRSICDLRRERAELEEEVLQLRAAVQIWTAVCHRTLAAAAGPATLGAEMCYVER